MSKALQDIGHLPTAPTAIHGDNKAELKCLHDIEMLSSRVKHNDSRHHVCIEPVVLGTVAYKYCPTFLNVADILTKAVPCAVLESQAATMGLRPISLK